MEKIKNILIVLYIVFGTAIISCGTQQDEDTEKLSLDDTNRTTQTSDTTKIFNDTVMDNCELVKSAIADTVKSGKKKDTTKEEKKPWVQEHFVGEDPY
ncbi:MAG: hypothetical protein ACT4ON_03635 [Bacteroidota bacterium]